MQGFSEEFEMAMTVPQSISHFGKQERKIKTMMVCSED